MYRLGARKYVVFEIDPIGCEPVFLKAKTKCAEKVNSYVATYNHKLGVMLEGLGKALRNSTFVLGKRFQLMEDLLANPTRYGKLTLFSFSAFTNPIR